MNISIHVTATNENPNTIANRLKAKLCREPTSAELADEAKRILREGNAALATAGKLPHQRGA